MKRMKSVISSILGFEWVQDVALKKACRMAANALMVLAAKSATVAGIVSAFGLTNDTLYNGLVAAGVVALEAIRGWAKHS